MNIFQLVAYCCWNRLVLLVIKCPIPGGKDTWQHLCSIISHPGRSRSYSSSQHITGSNWTMQSHFWWIGNIHFWSR